MAIDKKIDYVEQDGSLNFIKNSESVTVPKRFKARKNAPATKLAYITDAEAKMLKKQKPGTPHKGPKGIPSYDSYGSIEGGRDVGMSGAATSAAERGGGSGADARELAVESQRVRSGPDLPPGVVDKNVQDYRDAFIAAGGGRRVNPSFFDSRNTVSPAELARARAFNPAAFKAGRRGGIMDFFTGGGFLGNIIRGIGQKFGLGKRFNEPTYDMRQFSGINPTFQNDLGNEGLLSLLENEEDEDTFTNTVAPMSVNNNIKGIRFNNPIGGVDQFAREMEALEASIPRRPGQTEDISMRIRPRDMTGTLRDFYTNKGQTVTLADGRVVPTSDVIFEVYDDNINFRNVPTDLGNPYNDPRVVPEEKGLVGNEGIMSVAEVLQKDIDASKARGFKMLDRDTAVTLGLISPNVTEYEFEQLKQGNITEPGTYTA
tara:strand:+ start:753 stop:2042 length:1290 start_codon:yes stop_codon:yes gene_type:complete